MNTLQRIKPPHEKQLPTSASRWAFYGIISFSAYQVKKTIRQPSRLILIPYNQLRRYLLVARFFDFVADQTMKSMQRPSRLILIPYYQLRYYLLVMPYYRLLRPSLLWLLHVSFRFAFRLGAPISLMPNELVAAEAAYHYVAGYQLLQENKPEKSWRSFERCLRYSNHYFHFKIAATCLLHGLGRMREAIELYRDSNRIRLSNRALAGARKYEDYCLLDDFWASNIGHTAQLDYLVKLRMLEGRDPNDTILYLAPERKVANQFLLEQWRPYLRLITDPRKLPFPERYVNSLALDFYVPDMNEIGKYYMWELAAQTHRRWSAEGRGPLLHLAEDVQDRGRKALVSLGVPRDAWFVGLHVREPGFQPHHRKLHEVLNSRIEDYFPAIDEVVRRGGWVIRMGDPMMTRLPPLPNVIDYCHSAIRSDWMDVFLAATSRFFIGSASGVCYVPQNYGVPCVLSNWWPAAQRPWLSNDIFMPKLFQRIGSGQILSLEESLDEPFGYCNSIDYLQQKYGVTIKANLPEDIRAAVVEMFERTEGRAIYDQSDYVMRERAEGIYTSMAMKLYDSPGAFGAGILARDFLRRNPSFVNTVS